MEVLTPEQRHTLLEWIEEGLARAEGREPRPVETHTSFRYDS